MRVRTLLKQLRDFPDSDRDQAVAVLLMVGPIQGSVVTGYNYLPSSNELTLFTNGHEGAGMPRNLLLHSLSTQSVRPDAEVTHGGRPVLAVVPFKALGRREWRFSTDGGTTAQMGTLGPGVYELRVEVPVLFDDLVELDRWAKDLDDPHPMRDRLERLGDALREALGLEEL